MKIYISGPMTGLPNYNRDAFNAKAAELRAAGHAVFNPAEVFIGKGTWVSYIRHDIKQLMDCDAVYLLDGWQHSKGAQLEYQIADTLGMRVFGARSQPKQAEQRHAKILDAMHETFARKNADYGNSFHDLYAEFGLTSSLIRLQDKLSRLKTLSKQAAQVEDESLRDTLLDLANYAVMTVMELDAGGTES